MAATSPDHPGQKPANDPLREPDPTDYKAQRSLTRCRRGPAELFASGGNSSGWCSVARIESGTERPRPP